MGHALRTTTIKIGCPSILGSTVVSEATPRKYYWHPFYVVRGF